MNIFQLLYIYLYTFFSFNFNILYSSFWGKKKIGVGKEIRIDSKVYHLPNELGRAIVDASICLSTIFFDTSKVGKFCDQCNFHYNLNI
jgi:hypothetical protein